jgi:hypothetical protein
LFCVGRGACTPSARARRLYVHGTPARRRAHDIQRSPTIVMARVYVGGLNANVEKRELEDMCAR